MLFYFKNKLLYIITDGTSYKLGYSQDPKARLKSLQTSNPKPLILLGFTEGNLEDEARYHKLLNKSKLVGEWFNASPKLFEILSSWLALKPILAPSLETCLKSYNQLNKIRIHTAKTKALWLNAPDIAKLLNIRTDSLLARKKIISRKFKSTGILTNYVNEASFQIVFKDNESILAELNQYKATGGENYVK